MAGGEIRVIDRFTVIQSAIAVALFSGVGGAAAAAVAHRLPGLASSPAPRIQVGRIPEPVAAMGCDPSKTDPGRVSNFKQVYWDGWKYTASAPIGGVQATIWNYSPWVDPSSDYTYAWVMLTVDHGYGTDAPLVQNSWMERPYGERHTMFMWHQVGSAYYYTYADPPKAVKSYTNYQIQDSGGTFAFYVGGSYLFSHPAFFTPTEAQIAGETHSLRSQMPGGHGSANDYEDFLRSQYLTDSWHDFMPGGVTFAVDENGNDQSRYFGHAVRGSANLSIWDRDCLH